jgi:ribosome-associated protein
MNDGKARPKRIIKVKAKAAQMDVRELKISSEFIKLDSALKLADIAQTGGHAKILVQNGEIRVNGEVCTQRGKKLRPGDRLEFGRQIFVLKAADGQ